MRLSWLKDSHHRAFKEIHDFASPNPGFSAKQLLNKCGVIVRLSILQSCKIVGLRPRILTSESSGGRGVSATLQWSLSHLKHSYAFMSRFEKDESNQLTPFFSPQSQFVKEALCQNFVIFKLIFPILDKTCESNLWLDKAPSRTTGHLAQLFLQAVSYLPSQVIWLRRVKLLVY